MYLGHGVPADCSVVYGPIWLKLGWMVGWVMITIATSWRPNRPTGGAAGVQKVLFLSSLALNEQATRAMGRWRLSACVILRKQCLNVSNGQMAPVCVCDSTQVVSPKSAE